MLKAKTVLKPAPKKGSNPRIECPRPSAWLGKSTLAAAPRIPDKAACRPAWPRAFGFAIPVRPHGLAGPGVQGEEL